MTVWTSIAMLGLETATWHHLTSKVSRVGFSKVRNADTSVGRRTSYHWTKSTRLVSSIGNRPMMRIQVSNQ